MNTVGQYGGLKDGGDFIFACVVFIPNVKILINSYEIGWGITSIVGVSLAFYMGVHLVIS